MNELRKERREGRREGREYQGRRGVKRGISSRKIKERGKEVEVHTCMEGKGEGKSGRENQRDRGVKTR